MPGGQGASKLHAAWRPDAFRKIAWLDDEMLDRLLKEIGEEGLS